MRKTQHKLAGNCVPVALNHCTGAVALVSQVCALLLTHLISCPLRERMLHDPAVLQSPQRARILHNLLPAGRVWLLLVLTAPKQWQIAEKVRHKTAACSHGQQLFSRFA